MTDTVLPVYTVVVSPDNITLNENEAFSQTFIINATTEDTTAEPYDYVIDSIQISDTNLSKYVTISKVDDMTFKVEGNFVGIFPSTLTVIS